MKQRAPRNRTLTCSEAEVSDLSKDLVQLARPSSPDELAGRVVNQDIEEALPFLPREFVDLLVLDPPYNLTKNFNGNVFRSLEAKQYISWFDQMLSSLMPVLRPHATIYVCSDWRTSNLVFPVLEKTLVVRNRITWERDKGRGARTNWKNNTEDIWFCTLADTYCFNVDDVKLKRRVIAPYRSSDGKPLDWDESANGNYRLTHPSNIWSDITIPFWSMPENTDHPTQKPEKLIAKLLLASSNRGDFVLDPFAGSGTTAVVASKLDRRFCVVERDREYCCWALNRLNRAARDKTIQGYADGMFWERNSLSEQKTAKGVRRNGDDNLSLFDD
jgi:site-specific DNA-methyltransferase (adenine-specific)